MYKKTVNWFGDGKEVKPHAPYLATSKFKGYIIYIVATYTQANDKKKLPSNEFLGIFRGFVQAFIHSLPKEVRSPALQTLGSQLFKKIKLFHV